MPVPVTRSSYEAWIFIRLVRNPGYRFKGSSSCSMLVGADLGMNTSAAVRPDLSNSLSSSVALSIIVPLELGCNRNTSSPLMLESCSISSE